MRSSVTRGLLRPGPVSDGNAAAPTVSGSAPRRPELSNRRPEDLPSLWSWTWGTCVFLDREAQIPLRLF